MTSKIFADCHDRPPTHTDTNEGKRFHVAPLGDSHTAAIGYANQRAAEPLRGLIQHLLMAASVVTMVPCIVLFFVAQRHFVGGLTLGAVKG